MIPFDLKHDPHVVCGDSIANLQVELERRGRFHLANPERREDPRDSALVFTLAGVSLVEGGTIKLRFPDVSANKRVRLVIGIFNPGNSVFDGTAELGLVLPDSFRPTLEAYSIELPDRRFLHDLGGIPRVLPGAWQSRHASFEPYGLQDQQFRPIPAELRVFTESGVKTIAFELTLV